MRKLTVIMPGKLTGRIQQVQGGRFFLIVKPDSNEAIASTQNNIHGDMYLRFLGHSGEVSSCFTERISQIYPWMRFQVMHEQRKKYVPNRFGP